MFNPKSNNLLDEQLAFSGLEMNWVGAAISAGTAIVGGIMGSRSASKKNASAKKQEKKQKKFAKKTAKLTNKHNEKLDEADRANYYAMRDYNYDVQIKDWERGVEIQDYNYLQSLKRYQKSLTISNQQLDLNSLGEQQALSSQQDALRESFIQQQFQRRSTFDSLSQAFALANLDKSEQFNSLRLGTKEAFTGLKQGTKEIAAELRFGETEQANVLRGIKDRKTFGRLGFANTINTLMEQNNIAKETLLVESLVEQGAIQASAQAGKNASKRQQASLAKMQRGLMGLEAELSGNAKKAAIQLAELNTSTDLETSGVDLNLARLRSTTGLALDKLKSTTDLNLDKLRSTTGLNLKRIDNTIKNAQTDAKFNLDVMRENMRSNIDETQRNIEKIRLDRATADLNTRAGMMLFPDRIPYTPRPELPPERIFVERQKAIPGYVPPAQQQSVWAPLVSGIGKAAGSIASIDFGGGDNGGGGGGSFQSGAASPGGSAGVAGIGGSGFISPFN